MNQIVSSSKNNLQLPTIAGWESKVDLKESKPFSDSCIIEANNDLQAVNVWLKQYSHKNTTYLTYRRESDRFMLWCVHEVGKTLGQLSMEDFNKYIKFLQKPPKRWCATVGEIRVSGHGRHRWRPFLGPLSDSARDTALRVVNSLMNYLVDAAYLRANPLRLIKQRSKFNIKSDEYKYQVWSKILDDAEWEALQQALDELPEDNAYEIDNKKRTQFIFSCLYLLGLRISELAASTWNAFRFHQGAWWFFVRGKGDKLGHIPVNEQLLNYVKSYRKYLGKTAVPSESDSTYLIVSKKTSQPLSIKQMYTLVKAVARNAALKFEEGSISRQKLEKLSPHSLRHLSASHQDKLGIPMNIIQENLRHSSINTTKIYVHADDEARHKEMEKMVLDVEEGSDEGSGENLCLTIAISGNNVCTSFTLEKFIQVVETKILDSFVWCRDDNIDSFTIIKGYEQASKFGNEYKIKYSIANCKVDENALLSSFESKIIEAAEIRLLKVKVCLS